MPATIKLPEINFLVISGRLTRDPELRMLSSGRGVTKLRIASDRGFFNKTANEWQKETVFIDVNVWGEAAQRMKERLHKGSPVLVEGRLKFRQWDAKDGTKRSVHEVEARRVQPLEIHQSGASEEFEAAPDVPMRASDLPSSPAAFDADAPPVFGAASPAEAASDLEEVAL